MKILMVIIFFPKYCRWMEIKPVFNILSLVLVYTEIYYIYNRRNVVDYIIETYFIHTTNCSPHHIIDIHMVWLSESV